MIYTLKLQEMYGTQNAVRMQTNEFEYHKKTNSLIFQAAKHSEPPVNFLCVTHTLLHTAPNYECHLQPGSLTALVTRGFL